MTSLQQIHAVATEEA